MLVLLMAVVSLGMVNAQAITVSGTVTDAKDGTPLVGCSVQIKGTTKDGNEYEWPVHDTG